MLGITARNVSAQVTKRVVDGMQCVCSRPARLVNRAGQNAWCKCWKPAEKEKESEVYTQTVKPPAPTGQTPFALHEMECVRLDAVLRHLSKLKKPPGVDAVLRMGLAKLVV